MLPALACPVPLTLALSRPQLQHKVCFFNCSVRSFCWERQRIHLGAERMKEVLLLRALSAEAMKIKTPPEVSSPSQHLPSFLYSSQDLKFILKKQKATCTSLWQALTQELMWTSVAGTRCSLQNERLVSHAKCQPGRTATCWVCAHVVMLLLQHRTRQGHPTGPDCPGGSCDWHQFSR